MEFRDFLKVNEGKKKTVSMQVMNVSDFIQSFRGTGIDAKPNKKYDDEVVLTFDEKYTKDLVKFLGKQGFEKDDLEDMYPEIFE
jgi:hypothetical protein